MIGPEIEALEAQCSELDALLASLSADDWQRETRCPPMTIKAMAGHVGVVMSRFAEQLAEDVDGPATVDRVSYWTTYDVAVTGARVIDEGAQEAQREDFLGWWRDSISRALEAARETDASKIVRRRDRTLTAVDFTATRVLETGVHGMDIGHAAIKGERIHPSAVPIVVEILQGLLGAPLPRAMGWDAKTFILTGTGRRVLLHNERVTLGELAGRFPLLA